MKRSITNLTGDIIPVPRKIPEYSYHNKKIRDFDSDDFASMVLDNCDSEFNFKGIKGFTDIYEVDYLNFIPSDYARVYLYGVYEVVQECIRVNGK